MKSIDFNRSTTRTSADKSVNETQKTCVKALQLKAYVRGELDLNEIEKLSDHIENCEICSSELSKMDGPTFDSKARSLIEKLHAETGQTASIETDADESEIVPGIPSERREQDTRVGKFRIIREVGEGAFGRVFEAVDENLNRRAALKVPRMEQFSDQQKMNMFFAEAKMLAKIEHRNVVRVYEVDQTNDGQIFIAMNWINGETLRERLRREELSTEQTISIVGQIASALSALHAKRIIHRDLKPSNILIDESGHVYVADFGLAIDDRQQLSRRGEFAGTRAYMSPEQIRGEVDYLDGRSDLWSLGAIFYECLSGMKPFAGKGKILEDQILNRDVRPPVQVVPEIPLELNALVMDCLASQPHKRPSCADEFLKRLEFKKVSESQPSHAPPNAHRSLAWGTAMIGLTLIAVICGILATNGTRGNTNAAVAGSESAVPKSDQSESIPRKDTWYSIFKHKTPVSPNESSLFSRFNDDNTDIFDREKEIHLVSATDAQLFKYCDVDAKDFQFDVKINLKQLERFGVFWKFAQETTPNFNAIRFHCFEFIRNLDEETGADQLQIDCLEYTVRYAAELKDEAAVFMEDFRKPIAASKVIEIPQGTWLLELDVSKLLPFPVIKINGIAHSPVAIPFEIPSRIKVDAPTKNAVGFLVANGTILRTESPRLKIK